MNTVGFNNLLQSANVTNLMLIETIQKFENLSTFIQDIAETYADANLPERIIHIIDRTNDVIDEWNDRNVVENANNLITNLLSIIQEVNERESVLHVSKLIEYSFVKLNSVNNNISRITHILYVLSIFLMSLCSITFFTCFCVFCNPKSKSQRQTDSNSVSV